MKAEALTGALRATRAPMALIALMSCMVQAMAQDAPGPRIGDPDYGKSERAVRAADSPMRWIKMHSEAARAPAPAPARESAAPAPAGKPRVAATKAPSSKPAPLPAPATGTALAPNPVAQPAGGSTAAAAAAPDVPVAGAAAADDAPDLEFVERAEPAWDGPTMTKLRVGRVEVRFDVATDGHTSAPRIVSSTNKVLDKVALDTIRKWRFEPISKPRSATVEFGFDLDAGRADAAPAAAPAAVELTAIEQPEPEWGDALMQKLRKAQAQVRINVGTDGRLARFELLSASNPQLADPITAALKRWRFQPLDKPLTATVEFGFDIDRAAR